MEMGNDVIIVEYVKLQTKEIKFHKNGGKLKNKTTTGFSNPITGSIQWNEVSIFQWEPSLPCSLQHHLNRKRQKPPVSIGRRVNNTQHMHPKGNFPASNKKESLPFVEI